MNQAFNPRLSTSEFERSTSPLGRVIAPLVLAVTALCGSAGSPVLGADAAPAEGGYRASPLAVPAEGSPGFTLLPPTATGVVFTNVLSDAGEARNRLLEIGSGVALGDVDGDGRVDLYFCGIENANVLYRNLGDWRFEDITLRAGVGCAGQSSTGGALVDLDGDRDLDLLVNSLGGGTRLFRNDGHGSFAEDPKAGLFRAFGATSMALADIDGDGDLDLYVTNYRTDTFIDLPAGGRFEVRQRADGGWVVEPKERFLLLPSPSSRPIVIERGEPDVLYVNRGSGRFAPVPWHVGVFRAEQGQPIPETPTDWGLSVMFRDLNGDGLPDLYVCNDFVNWPDRVWLNRSGKFFQPAPAEAFRHLSLASMAADAADINRDGFDDLVVADMLSPQREARAWQRPDTLQENVRWPIEDPRFAPEIPRNTLHLARGDGTYAEIAPLAGVAATDWTTAAVFLDVDLDGWEDLLLAAGNKHDVQDTDALAAIGDAIGNRTAAMRQQDRARLPHRKAPAVALRNRRDLTFEDASARWGFGAVGIAHGMALADLDGDGDLDVVLNGMNEPARLYRNNSVAPRIAVRLAGAKENTRGVGARITVRGGPVTQSQEMIAGGRFCSSDDPMRVFAAGTARAFEIEVRWRSGQRSLVPNAQPDHLYEIAELFASPAPPAAPAPPPLFEDVSGRLKPAHVDAPFDDFARQPLLPRKLSALGPGVAWADVDGDGHDDLLVGAGKGGRLAVLANGGRGGFTARTNAPVGEVSLRDQTGLLAWPHPHGTPRILVGESNWEDADTNAPAFRMLSVEGAPSAPSDPSLATGMSATGPLALADVDADGDLDLFVGGRVSAGRYPEPARSVLLLNDQGGWQPAPGLAVRGLVSGAVFTDYDGDGDPDLALACEWDAIRVFRNDGGQFTEVTAALGLKAYAGWWNGITAGDFDGDGRLDLAASNWGRNWRLDQPPGVELEARLYYGEFGEDGVVHTLMASLDPALGKITPWRERRVVAAVLPSLADRAPDHHAYGRASVSDVLGEHAGNFRELVARTFDSMVFLNRGDRFEPRPLPLEAQFAPAFGLNVADFDGDGHEDLFLAQNFFGVDAETSRHDAGVGLVLLGDGRGGFRALRPGESGVAAYGEQRGSAVADFDRDGRVDLALGQNAGPTKLWRNVRARPGLRVAFRGGPGNPQGVGAVGRIVAGGRAGPAREMHAGSGYWSQDSGVSVLTATSAPEAVWIRWPGGRTTTTAVPPGTNEVVVQAPK